MKVEADIFNTLEPVARDVAGLTPEWLNDALAQSGFGGTVIDVMPPLARAFMKRKKWVAAYACLREALEAGVSERELAEELRVAEGALGVALTAWKARKVRATAGR